MKMIPAMLVVAGFITAGSAATNARELFPNDFGSTVIEKTVADRITTKGTIKTNGCVGQGNQQDDQKNIHKC